MIHQVSVEGKDCNNILYGKSLPCAVRNSIGPRVPRYECSIQLVRSDYISIHWEQVRLQYRICEYSP